MVTRQCAPPAMGLFRTPCRIENKTERPFLRTRYAETLARVAKTRQRKRRVALAYRSAVPTAPFEMKPARGEGSVTPGRVMSNSRGTSRSMQPVEPSAAHPAIFEARHYSGGNFCPSFSRNVLVPCTYIQLVHRLRTVLILFPRASRALPVA